MGVPRASVAEEAVRKPAWLNISANLENSATDTGLGKVSFHSNFKEGNAKERSTYCTSVLILYASNFMVKLLQARLQQY